MFQIIQVLLGDDRGNRSVADGRGDLLEDLFAHIPGGEDPRDRRPAVRVGQDVPFLVEFKDLGQEMCFGRHADGDEHAAP